MIILCLHSLSIDAISTGVDSFKNWYFGLICAIVLAHCVQIFERIHPEHCIIAFLYLRIFFLVHMIISYVRNLVTRLLN